MMRDASYRVKNARMGALGNSIIVRRFLFTFTEADYGLYI